MDFDDLWEKAILIIISLIFFVIFVFLCFGLFQSIKLQNLEIKEKEKQINQNIIENKID